MIKQNAICLNPFGFEGILSDMDKSNLFTMNFKGELMKQEKLQIEGMSCGHCVMAVKKELAKLPVDVKTVDIGTAEVEYDENKVSKEDLVKAVDEAGYRVVNA